jgi:hypothetical protein
MSWIELILCAPAKLIFDKMLGRLPVGIANGSTACNRSVTSSANSPICSAISSGRPIAWTTSPKLAG